VGSIIIGVLLGGGLITPRVSAALLGFDFPLIDTPVDTPPEAAIVVIMGFYMVAAIFNWFIPDTGVDHRVPSKNPFYLIREFSHCVTLLWRDKLGQISLATTTLFWGAGATLQFIVIEWARAALDFDLSKAAILQGVTAVGIAIGAVLASAWVSLDRAVRVIPLGIALGLVVIVLDAVSHVWLAVGVMVAIGAMAGFFVVPMNALLQHRGHHLVGAGRSIAVQNFNENTSILLMIALYSVLLGSGLSIYAVIVVFGLFVAGTMAAVQLWYRESRRRHGEEIERLLDFAAAEDPQRVRS
jgi:hypothetical protein